MRLLPYRPLALGAVSFLALFGLSAAPSMAGASTTPAPAHASVGSSVAAKSLAAASTTASTASTTGPASPLPAGTKQACATPTRVGQEACMLFLHGVATSRIHADLPVTGAYAPADLQSAYNLTSASAADGAGETVAIVDAYADPDLAGDLATYRAQYGLSACTTSNGCFSELNEHGGTSLPTGTDPTGGWEAEQAADVEMVSAACPNCKILMVEANSTSITDLGNADNTAASRASFVSNSWGGLDFPGADFDDSFYFNHAGVAITFASGDFGYGPSYPASSQLVTSVGGTYLTQTTSNSRGWTESVWNGQPASEGGATQSGCSASEGKPSWQTDSGCANRTQNDVSAVASGPDGISIYDSFDTCAGYTSAWCPAFGTSLATPIIAAVYALANELKPDTYPSTYLYNGRPAGSLYPVTSGSDGGCESSRLYLCNAADSLSNGYNGPAGWGTPDGITAFQDNLPADFVSVYNPGPTDIESGIAYTEVAQPTALDSGGLALTYSQSGLPAGLSLSSATGLITGKTTAVGTHTVKVTVSDTSGASSTVFFVIAVASSLDSATYRPGTGAVHLDWGGKCMDDTGNSSKNGNKIQIWACNGGPGQNWTFYPDTDPSDANVGEVTIHGKCLDIVNRGTANGSRLQLYSCTGGLNQQWYIAGQAGELISLSADKCIDDPYSSTSNGKQLDIWNCNDEPWQAWTLPASPVVSGIAGKCMDDAGGSNKNGNKIQIYNCNGEATQRWTVGLDGSIRIDGKCLDATGYGTQDGTKIQLYTCTGNTNQWWVIGAFGMLENYNAQKCLADPNNTTANGTQLVLEDCYGAQGEIWSES